MTKCLLLAGLCVLIMVVLGRLATIILLSKRSSWKSKWLPVFLMVIIVASGFALTSVFFYTVAHENFFTRGNTHGVGQGSETKLYCSPADDSGDDISTHGLYLEENN